MNGMVASFNEDLLEMCDIRESISVSVRTIFEIKSLGEKFSTGGKNLFEMQSSIDNQHNSEYSSKKIS
jgi:hypothetical protein